MINQLKELKQKTEPLTSLDKQLEDAEVLFHLACDENDESALGDVKTEIAQFEGNLKAFTLKQTFTKEEDERNAFFSIQAGAGGTDACDWTSMLLRMYTRYAERKNFKAALLDYQANDEAGIKSAMLHIQGRWAYGYLKGEKGVHRLVRISPFDANARRHTSFAAVYVIPELEKVEADIDEKDLKYDFFHSSGPGGQNVNVTDSAVRITHLPSGLVVSCQNERSQHKNRAMAMKILTVRLYEKKKEEQEELVNKQYGNKTSVSWSNQIRSYTLQPYTLVKDHRTGCEVGNIQAVLDGELESFIEAFLFSSQSVTGKK